MLNTLVNTLIFDLDDTLIDRNAAMQLNLQHWLRLQGHDEALIAANIDDIMVHDDWGYNDRIEFAQWLLQQFATGEARKQTPQALLDWMVHNIVQYVTPYPGVTELLGKLKTRYRLVLATNGAGDTQRGKLQQSQLLPFFQPENIFISGEIGVPKPNHGFYKILIERLQLDTTSAIMLGDNPVNDIQSAHECGLLTGWISQNRPMPEALPATVVISSITDLEQWVKP